MTATRPSAIPVRVEEAVEAFAAAPPYRPVTETLVADTPYRRPLDADRLAAVDWHRPLGADDLRSDGGLTAHRLLMNIYESDTLFLPAAGLDGHERAFGDFYDSGTRLYADLARPTVERHAFSFLDQVQVTGPWDVDTLEAHVVAAIDEAVNAESPVLAAIAEAADPRRAAETMVAQMALDGLTEATAMSMNLGGAYGIEQSELFKIFTDEFGYGVFDAKHSTLFGALCRSLGMADEAHRYWHFYLPSWIAANNYFYYVTRNRTGFFRYIGAVALLEATFAPWFATMTKALRAVYGDAVDTRYCDEHAHIDVHHGRMAVQDLLLPLARKHGPSAVRDLVRGIEETRLLGAQTDADAQAQMLWLPHAEDPTDDGARGVGGRLVEVRAGAPFRTGVADADTVLTVLSGEVALHWSPTGDPLRVPAGRRVRIPRQRLYGLRAERDATVSVVENTAPPAGTAPTGAPGAVRT